jgi:hypothetical protein
LPLHPLVQSRKSTFTATGFALTLLVCICSSTIGGLAAPTTQPHTHEITISGAKWAQGVTISVHDTLVIPPPASYDQWRVHPANSNIVRLLTKGDRVRRPGSRGWRLEAIGRGTTTVTFVPFVPSGENSSSPNEPKFTLRVTVQ